VIITLGNPSTKFLLKTKLGITKIHGVWGRYNGIAVMPTYHPSFILRNGGDSSPQKREVWEDIKKGLRYLESGESDEDIENKKTEVVMPIAQDGMSDDVPKKKDEQGSLF
jgi:hypothetical protein